MSPLYRLWVEHQDGAEYRNNILLDDEETAEAIRKRLDQDDRVSDYTLEPDESIFSLTADTVMEDLEPFLIDGIS